MHAAHGHVERPKPTSLIIFIYFSAMWEGTPLDEVLNSSIEKNKMWKELLVQELIKFEKITLTTVEPILSILPSWSQKWCEKNSFVNPKTQNFYTFTNTGQCTCTLKKKVDKAIFWILSFFRKKRMYSGRGCITSTWIPNTGSKPEPWFNRYELVWDSFHHPPPSVSDSVSVSADDVGGQGKILI